MGKFAPDRTVLPIPDRAFGGALGRSIEESVADWSIIAPVKAPEGAPNVLVVLIDDAGFGSIDSYGGPVSTPTFTRVQEMGLTYNAFHVTAVCSPTRAALLTGRNHHRAGMGSIVEYPGPFPGYTGAVPRSCAPFPRILKENGYVTGGFGKWHLTPDNVQGAAARSTGGRRRGASTTGGGSCPVRPASTTRSSPRTTRSSACPRARTASSTTSPTT